MGYLIAVILVLIVVLFFILKKGKKVHVPHENTDDPVYRNAMQFIADFKTASAGIDTKKEFEIWKSANDHFIDMYSIYGDFNREYIKIYNEILKKFK